MARELWFLRHGEAEDAGDDPRLTGRGRAQGEAAGRALARLGLAFDAILTSPRARARETAELAGEALDAEPVEHEPLSGGFDRDDALAVLADRPDGARVLLVGHEPDFSQTIEALAGAQVDMKKGGVAGLRVEGEGAELISLLAPED
jgi:phosphohistidine phosphatase